MVFLVGGANSASDFEIENSLRFNDSDSAYLSITPSSAGNRRTFTYSGWIKTDVATASSKALLSCGSDSGSNDYIMFQSGDKLRFSFGTEGNGDIITTRLFRDPAAWYHIVWAVDTTQGTAANRVKLYVNGTQASDVTGTYPDQNYDTSFNNTEVQRIGARAYSATQYYEGYMSDVYLIDGAQKAASDFGETNDNGVWVPKKYTGTYGTNGFKLEFQQTGTSANASGMGADTSGNGNHLTPSNLTSIDVTTDTPTNNFATLNPLSNKLQASYSEGNLDEACNDNYGVGATQAFANGKWYWEVKIKAGDNNLVGIANADEQSRFTTTFGINNYSLTVYGVNGMIIREGSNVEDVDDTYGANDIVGVAVDMDSGTRTVQFYKNGSAFGSAATLPTNWGLTLPMIRKGGSSQTSSFNFGNPAFSISSGNADENGYGNFEYSVPSGFYALCTKNLAEFG